MDKRLAEAEYLAGEYSIADIACYPWIRPERQGQNIDDFPNLKRWMEAIAARPAVQRGMAILADARPPQMDEEAKKNLFGDKQYQRR